MALQNRSQPGQEKTLQFAHSAATVAKTPIVSNARAFIPLNTADAGVQNAFWREAEVSGAPKATGEAWSIGDTLYWNATNGNFTKTATSATKCAFALEAALSADAVGGLIAFNSFAP
jgi:hypothetical protein